MLDHPLKGRARSAHWQAKIRQTYATRRHAHMLRHILISSGCWLWSGAMSPEGYGRLGGRQYAHRAVYEHLVGEIPLGLQIDHLCRNRRCVRPSHLDVVASRENTLRGARTKLSDADASEIRRRYTAGERVIDLANEYGIDDSTASRVARGVWRS